MSDFILSPTERKAIETAIQEAEKRTSGEIKVHLDKHCKTDILDRATEVFFKLKMHQTDLRNGVLFYFATADKEFAVIGDAGINDKVPDNFWNTIKENLQLSFKEKKYAEGIIKGISLAGEQLREYFPYQPNDKNELTNEISTEKRLN